MNVGCVFSGGPIVDFKGNVLAVNQSYFSGDYGYCSFGVPVKFLKKLLLAEESAGVFINQDEI